MIFIGGAGKAENRNRLGEAEAELHVPGEGNRRMRVLPHKWLIWLKKRQRAFSKQVHDGAAKATRIMRTSE
jgi:hypothetical protein